MVIDGANDPEVFVQRGDPFVIQRAKHAVDSQLRRRDRIEHETTRYFECTFDDCFFYSADDSRVKVHMVEEHGWYDDRSNLDKAEQAMEAYIPRCVEGSILIITRSQELRRRLAGNCNTLEIRSPDQYRSHNIVRKATRGSGIPTDHEVLLSSQLDFDRSAISLAAFFIQILEADVPGFMRRLQEYSKDNTAMSTKQLLYWRVAFPYLSEQDELVSTTLSVLSFFRSTDVPKSLLEALCDEYPAKSLEEGKPTADSVVAELEKYFLIRYQKDGFKLAIHGVAHSLRRDWLRERRQTLVVPGIAIKVLHKVYPRNIIQDRELCSEYLGHALEALSVNIDISTSTGLDIRWELVSRVVSTLNRQGLWGQAEEITRKYVNAVQDIFGDDHPKTRNSLLELARTYQEHGKLLQARLMQQEVVDFFDKYPGAPNQEELQVALLDLATTLNKLHEWDHAVRSAGRIIYTVSVDKNQRGLLLEASSILASAYQGAGQWEDAEEYTTLALNDMTSLYGPSDPRTLRARESAAKLYCLRGEPKKGQSLHQGILDERVEQLGRDHPDTIQSLLSLAGSLEQQEQYSEAISVYVQAIETLQGSQSGSPGVDNAWCIEPMAKLAALYEKIGDISGAQERHRSVLRFAKRVLGQNHPTTIAASLAFRAFDARYRSEISHLAGDDMDGASQQEHDVEITTRTSTLVGNVDLNDGASESLTDNETLDGFLDAESSTGEPLRKNTFRLRQIRSRLHASSTEETQYWRWNPYQRKLEHRVLRRTHPVQWALPKDPFDFSLDLDEVSAVRCDTSSDNMAAHRVFIHMPGGHETATPLAGRSKRGDLIVEFKRRRTLLRFLGLFKEMKVPIRIVPEGQSSEWQFSQPKESESSYIVSEKADHAEHNGNCNKNNSPLFQRLSWYIQLRTLIPES